MPTDKPRDPAEMLRDGAAIQRALSVAVREAIRRHKLLGLPVAEWRDGQVVWIPPGEMPAGNDEPGHQE